VVSREEIVERSIEGFNQADWALLESLWHADGEIVAPEGWPEGEPVAGWPGILAQFKRLKDSWDEDRAEPLSHTRSGDRICTRFRWTARGEASGLTSETEMWMVSDISDGRFERVQYFLDEEAARAALEAEA
jgi:hypothetical protein